MFDNTKVGKAVFCGHALSIPDQVKLGFRLKTPGHRSRTLFQVLLHLLLTRPKDPAEDLDQLQQRQFRMKTRTRCESYLPFWDGFYYVQHSQRYSRGENLCKDSKISHVSQDTGQDSTLVMKIFQMRDREQLPACSEGCRFA